MWQRIKDGARRFMTGRYGADQLSRFILVLGIALYVTTWITKINAFAFAAMILYFWSIFRMFSRNVEKRGRENQRYIKITRGALTSIRQFFNRLKNSKQYKYFRCPGCKSRLKLPRGVGEVTVTCGACKRQFRKAA